VKGWDGMGWDAVADGAYVVAKEVAMWFCRQFLSRIMKKEFGCENNQSSVSFLKYHRSAADSWCLQKYPQNFEDFDTVVRLQNTCCFQNIICATIF
jgi:hypothetical protein